jgi:hypothetical protein
LSSELTTIPAPRTVASLAGGSVTAIVPTTFDEVYRFAQVVAASGLAPDTMKTPEQVTIAILTGLEIGVKPMQAIQGIAVIGKRPCIWGDLALAICKSSGVLEYVTETYEGVEPSDWRNVPVAQRGYKAVCRIKRKGEPEVVNEFSINDAITASLWGKSGPWTTNPKRMLKMRSRGFGLRDTCPDVMKGMMVAEEMVGSEEEIEEARATPAKKVRGGPPAAPVSTEQPKAQITSATETATAAQPAEQQAKAEIVEDAVVTEIDKPAEEVKAEAKTAEREDFHPERDAGPAHESEPSQNPVEILEELEDKLTHATTVEMLEEMYDDFGAEELLQDTNDGVYAARRIKDERLALIQNKIAADKAAGEAAQTDPAPAATSAPVDVFAPLSTYQDEAHYAQHLESAKRAVKTPDDGQRLAVLWNETKTQRNAVCTDAFKRRAKASINDVVQKAAGGYGQAGSDDQSSSAPTSEPSATKPKGDDGVPSTPAEYTAMFEARAAAVTDLEGAQSLKKFFMNGEQAELREDVLKMDPKDRARLSELWKATLNKFR